MLRTVIIGTGHVATHLFHAFYGANTVEVVQVVGRRESSLAKFAGAVAVSHNFEQLADADLYLIAVKDDAIAQVSAHLTHKKGLVAHTAGAMPMHCLLPENRGVFYPLQTFTAGQPVDFATIPICLEAQNKASLGILQQLAATITEKVYEIDSEQRKKLHLAAVFVNNFTNHLYNIGETLCQQAHLPFDLLRPLILETAQKVQSLSPTQAQTGPARRGDQKSIQAHLSLLANPIHAELYKKISQAIQKHYEEEL